MKGLPRLMPASPGPSSAGRRAGRDPCRRRRPACSPTRPRSRPGRRSACRAPGRRGPPGPGASPPPSGRPPGPAWRGLGPLAQLLLAGVQPDEQAQRQHRQDTNATSAAFRPVGLPLPVVLPLLPYRPLLRGGKPIDRRRCAGAGANAGSRASAAPGLVVHKSVQAVPACSGALGRHHSCGAFPACQRPLRCRRPGPGGGEHR